MNPSDGAWNPVAHGWPASTCCVRVPTGRIRPLSTRAAAATAIEASTPSTSPARPSTNATMSSSPMPSVQSASADARSTSHPRIVGGTTWEAARATRATARAQRFALDHRAAFGLALVMGIKSSGVVPRPAGEQAL
ncbi:MAG: hypothetical protein U0166_13995 [Acidobacteriota bacterium]